MPAVLVHGVPETARLWNSVRAHLQRKDVVTVDLPGFGNPRPNGFGATMDDYAAWLIGQVPPEEQQLPGGLAKSSGAGTVTQVLDILRALPAEEQQARVAALREAERSCAPGDRLEILTGTPGSG